MDVSGPTSLALAKAAVSRGGYVALRYKVRDEFSLTASVKVKIYKNRKPKLTLRLGSRAVGNTLTYRYHCTLAKGTCSWRVYAADEAGNAQRSIGAKTLIVR